MKTFEKPGDVSPVNCLKRRQFLCYIVASAALISSCTKDSGSSGSNNSIDLGSGDVGVLNYLYALEQLQTSFYIQVVSKPYKNPLADDELDLMTNIRDHEIIHRGFYKSLLGTNAIPVLEFDFSSTDFSNRDSVMATAKTLKDISVSAYNGAAQLLTNASYLLAAGKIASVEARHAAYIHDVFSDTSYGSFADNTVVNTDGLDLAALPDAVLASVSSYITSSLDASHLPTN
ncbi:MAG: ferritin-like domain-containing protein [Bacteroidetes bacterium]|nr:ferritin-like domain-containing protein [Bacteroidota bacterium]